MKHFFFLSLVEQEKKIYTKIVFKTLFYLIYYFVSYSLIRLGKQLGFDFQKNSEEKIGFLRNFVRERKKKA